MPWWAKPSNNSDPLIPSQIPRPWEIVQIGIHGPLPSGESTLGAIDALSRWPKLHILKLTNWNIISEKIEQKTFSTHEYANERNWWCPKFNKWRYPYLLVDVWDKTLHLPKTIAGMERFYRTLGKVLRTITCLAKILKKT